MLALARVGRRADALDQFRAMRRRLVDELGVEPRDSLRQAHLQILTGEVSMSSAPVLTTALTRPTSSRVGRPEKALDSSASPVALFAQQLRELRYKAGAPTFRDLARWTGLAPTTLSKAMGGDRLPTLAVTLRLVRVLADDEDIWRRRWEQAAAAQRQTGPFPLRSPGTTRTRQENCPRPGLTPAQFVQQMRRLRAWAGNPSLRELYRYGGVPASTLSDILRRDRLPRLAVLQAFLHACGVPENEQREWEAAWETLAAQSASSADPVNPELQ